MADFVVKSAMLLQNSVTLLLATLATTAMRTTTAKFRTMGCRPCGVGKMGKMDMASEDEGEIIFYTVIHRHMRWAIFTCAESDVGLGVTFTCGQNTNDEISDESS